MQARPPVFVPINAFARYGFLRRLEVRESVRISHFRPGSAGCLPFSVYSRGDTSGLAVSDCFPLVAWVEPERGRRRYVPLSSGQTGAHVLNRSLAQSAAAIAACSGTRGSARTSRIYRIGQGNCPYWNRRIAIARLSPPQRRHFNDGQPCGRAIGGGSDDRLRKHFRRSRRARQPDVAHRRSRRSARLRLNPRRRPASGGHRSQRRI